MVTYGYKDTEIGVIPIEWEVVKLETVCDVRDGTHESPKYKKDGIPFITSKHLTDNGVDFSDVNYISIDDHINFSKRSLVENGDILFGMIGTIGKPLIVNYNFKFSIKNVALLKFKNNTKLNNSFTLNLLKSTIIDKQFSKLSNGGVQSFIALGMIRSLKIPLPPLKEQEKIADILSTADEKIDAIDLQIQKAETLKKGLLQKLLSEGIGHSEFKDSELGKIPESWEVVELGSISDILDPHPSHRAPKEEANGYPFVGIGDISESGIINLSSARKISLNDVIKQNDCIQINENDIGFGRVASVGKIIKFTKYDFPFALSPTMAVVKAKQINNSFLYQFLSSTFTKKQFKNLTSGSTRIALGIQNLRKILILIPPLEEQKQIANILSTADEKLEVLRAKKEKYETLKKGLLQKLLSGEVRV